MAKWLAGGGVMADRILGHDWTCTSLGPLENWPDTLKTTLALCLGSHFPQAVLWGPDLLTFHNDAFLPILGRKPVALGVPFAEVWQEAWDDIRCMADRALEGEAVYIQDFPLVIDRNKGPERAYFTFCYSPIRDLHGNVLGMLDTVTETTATVLGNQRLAFLDTLGRAVAQAVDPEEILATTTRLLAEHLGLSSCIYAVMQADDDTFTVCGEAVTDASPSLIGEHRLGAFGKQVNERLRSGLTLAFDDCRQALPKSEAAVFAALGITATCCVPLIKGARLTALMAVNSASAHAWTEYERVLLGDVTERSWAHIQHAQSTGETQAALLALEALNSSLEQHVQTRTTQLLHTEAELRQAQKLEAIGQLTGGVAHDFNNILTIIHASLHFLQRPGLDDDRRTRYLRTMVETVERGSKLTGQLLAFARRQALNPQVFDAAARLAAMADLFDTAAGASIDVELDLPASPCHVRADISQLETAVINLMLNARDAMAGVGTVRVRLQAHQHLPVSRDEVPDPCAYAAISVADTGVGISTELFERIFDPFFTTKPAGQGTGLGLSQVFGFAKQSGGDIKVSSVEGKGTTFTLYLPQQAPTALSETDRTCSVQAG
ncbi:GAF domain-containing protein [Pseudomonas fulva]|uniref:ATP-binding protein n=1 Tax=Pseudomonas fulva TaxID=47880 RepID=UPI000ED962BD|nr:ATP-binding protein [Pseudomonas fulva]NIX91907.1 GAF domain-containing protein [Pseudomonas fulva]HAL67035.1 hybrid sensor histidine kinase/response regulator [Pseudomonas sp.]